MAEKGDFIANKKQVFELSMLPTSQSGFATEARINTELGIAFLWLRGYPFGWWLSNKSTIYQKRVGEPPTLESNHNYSGKLILKQKPYNLLPLRRFYPYSSLT
jgi:hypothetical protein